MSNQGNTEGSTAFSFRTSVDHYILGLWLADGYWRASSIGLTSIFVPAYLAGRVDGDGHFDLKHRTGLRIAYGSGFDARRDWEILKAGRSVLSFEEKLPEAADDNHGSRG